MFSSPRRCGAVATYGTLGSEPVPQLLRLLHHTARQTKLWPRQAVRVRRNKGTTTCLLACCLTKHEPHLVYVKDVCQCHTVLTQDVVKLFEPFIDAVLVGSSYA